MAAKLSPKQRKILTAYAENGCWSGRDTQAIEGMQKRGLLVWQASKMVVTDEGRAALASS